MVEITEDASRDKGTQLWWPLMIQAHPDVVLSKASMGTVHARLVDGTWICSVVTLSYCWG